MVKTKSILFYLLHIKKGWTSKQFVSTLLTQISWSNHLAIMSKAKTAEERHFYITLCIKELYSARELDGQINSGYYERYILSKEKLLPEPNKGIERESVFGLLCY